MATLVKTGGVFSNPSIQEWLVANEVERDALIGKVGAGSIAYTVDLSKVWQMDEDLITWIEV